MKIYLTFVKIYNARLLNCIFLSARGTYKEEHSCAIDVRIKRQCVHTCYVRRISSSNIEAGPYPDPHYHSLHPRLCCVQNKGNLKTAKNIVFLSKY